MGVVAAMPLRLVAEIREVCSTDLTLDSYHDRGCSPDRPALEEENAMAENFVMVRGTGGGPGSPLPTGSARPGTW